MHIKSLDIFVLIGLLVITLYYIFLQYIIFLFVVHWLYWNMDKCK
jgi:hypothetical protein